ncbi:hypothetical protein FTX61_11615 [Nitriliruptoraceae bacterium ZYF776]|nr:hypothetical protein [Profundirhabdus halotolerans]
MGGRCSSPAGWPAEDGEDPTDPRPDRCPPRARPARRPPCSCSGCSRSCRRPPAPRRSRRAPRCAQPPTPRWRASGAPARWPTGSSSGSPPTVPSARWWTPVLPLATTPRRRRRPTRGSPRAAPDRRRCRTAAARSPAPPTVHTARSCSTPTSTAAPTGARPTPRRSARPWSGPTSWSRRPGTGRAAPRRTLRVRCTNGGDVAVTSVRVTSRDFTALRTQLAARGHRTPREKYLVFADFPPTNPAISGMAEMYDDARRSVDNLHNGARPMYAVVYRGYFSSRTPLHELAHTMGAVQPSAPGSDGSGHCRVDHDVMCYRGGTLRCPTMVFDCGNDTYFSTATRPGQWLHEHWNLGWEGNRFIQLGTAGGRRTATGPGGFRDTHGHPHAAGIAKVAAAGIAGGYGDGTYRPNATVTRGQMATFLQRALELPAAPPAPFRDLVGSVHDTAIGALAATGITTGDRDLRFRPEDPVVRGQMATFLARGWSLSPGRSAGFRDTRGSVHELAIDAVAAADITVGFSDGTFRPGDRVTRGQMATFLARALGL